VILSIAAHLISSAVDIAIDMPFTKSFGSEAHPLEPTATALILSLCMRWRSVFG
jgi:hypothetical protein